MLLKFVYVYGPNIISYAKVRQWCHLLKEGRMKMHDQECSSCPSVIMVDLIDKVNEKNHENHCLTVSQLSDLFPDVSWSVIYDVLTEKFCYKNMCARWVLSKQIPQGKN